MNESEYKRYLEAKENKKDSLLALKNTFVSIYIMLGENGGSYVFSINPDEENAVNEKIGGYVKDSKNGFSYVSNDTFTGYYNCEKRVIVENKHSPYFGNTITIRRYDVETWKLSVFGKYACK